jgi:lipopolysaccharide export system permease protein
VKTLHKYLTLQVLVSLLLTVAVFTFVLLLGTVLKEILVLLVNGQARISTALEAIGLLIPFVCVYALPMGLLTATLLVFGRFSADQELTAARASGISLLSLVTPVLLLSLLCCGVSAWFNMDLGPRSRVAYLKLIASARAGLMQSQLPAGQPIYDFPGYIFLVGENHGGDLKDVTIEWLKYNTTIYAPQGQYAVDATNKVLTLTLFNAVSSTVTSNGTTVLSSFPIWQLPPIDLNTSTNRNSKPNISDMTFWQLQDTARDLERFDLPAKAGASSQEMSAQFHEVEKLIGQTRAEMHRQIAFSFACFGFALVGIPLGIRMHRRETNVGIAIALGLVLVYYSFIILGKSLAARPELAPHLIFWLPNFIFQAVGAVLLWRANRGI